MQDKGGPQQISQVGAPEAQFPVFPEQNENHSPAHGWSRTHHNAIEKTESDRCRRPYDPGRGTVTQNSEYQRYESIDQPQVQARQSEDVAAAMLREFLGQAEDGSMDISSARRLKEIVAVLRERELVVAVQVLE